MTIQDRADEIAADFEFLDDWETRYAHIIDLGKANPGGSYEIRPIAMFQPGSAGA